MKSTVFVRPNLKMILLGAILVVVVQHFITNGHSQAPTARPAAANARETPDAEMEPLIKQAVEKPTPEIYRHISAGYERRADYRKAILYLRRAEKVAQIQDAE